MTAQNCSQGRYDEHSEYVEGVSEPEHGTTQHRYG